MVGVAHPNPAKAAEFRNIDLVSSQAAISAAVEARVRHFIYISVAHPAPVMKAYITVRTECENKLIASGLNATILQPWYVLGPGHRIAGLICCSQDIGCWSGCPPPAMEPAVSAWSLWSKW